MSENKMTDLLPCPFCGSDAHAMQSFHSGGPYWFAECQGAFDCPGGMMDETAYGTKNELIKAWNTRADQPITGE